MLTLTRFFPRGGLCFKALLFCTVVILVAQIRASAAGEAERYRQPPAPLIVTHTLVVPSVPEGSDTFAGTVVTSGSNLPALGSVTHALYQDGRTSTGGFPLPTQSASPETPGDEEKTATGAIADKFKKLLSIIVTAKTNR